MSTARTKSIPIFSLSIIALTYFLILPTGVLLTAALLPTFMARIADSHPRRYLTFCIGSLNIAGTLPFTFMLWQGEHTINDALTILSHQYSWLSFYGSSAIGLLIYSLMPSVMRTLRLNQLNSNIKNAETNQKQLIELWGEKILPEHKSDDSKE
jgi:hypothetical protein